MLGLAGVVGPEALAATVAPAKGNLAGAAAGGGLAGAAMGQSPLAPHAPQFPAKAKRVIFLFMNGGPSQVDTFDPKPKLAEYANKPIPLDLRTERKTGAALASPFKFKKYGQSGIEDRAECILWCFVPGGIKSVQFKDQQHGWSSTRVQDT